MTDVNLINYSGSGIKDSAIDYIVSKYYGKSWLEENDKVKLSKEKFKSYIKYENSKDRKDGSKDLYFNLGELFYGHGIEISINKNGKVSGDTIYG